MTTTTKKPPAMVQTRVDARGLTVELPKASSAALVKCRDVCAAIGNAAPVLSAKAFGIRKALDSLIEDLKGGPIAIANGDEGEEQQ